MKSVRGYSTDIYPTMRNYANKGYGHFEKSATTKISGTNIHGKSYDKLKNYFGNPNEDGELFFKDMTSDQVSKWNSEMADQYGMYINPKTRTAEQYIFVTGEKPQQSIF